MSAALVLFVAAALGGLVTNYPFKKYSTLTIRGLDDAVSSERWLKAPDDVRWSLARTVVEMIKGAKRGNSVKAGWLIAAMICELAAVVALAITAAQLVRT